MNKRIALLSVISMLVMLFSGCKTDIEPSPSQVSLTESNDQSLISADVSQLETEYSKMLFIETPVYEYVDKYYFLEYIWLENDKVLFLCGNLSEDENTSSSPYEFFLYDINTKEIKKIFQGDFADGGKSKAKLLPDGRICVYGTTELLFFQNNVLQDRQKLSANSLASNIIEISPDGKQVAYNNNLYQTVVSPTDNIQKQTKIFDKVSDMLWMPDGKHIVQVLDETGINIYNFETQKANFVPVESDILWFLFPYDNEHVILYDYGAGIDEYTSHVYKINIITGEKALIYESNILSTITFGENAVYDEKRIAPESITDYSAFILKKDLQTNEFFQVSPVFEQIYSMKASSDGKQIFADVKQDGERKYVILQQQ